MILEGCEGISLPCGLVVKNPLAHEAGDRMFSIDPWSGKMPRAPGRFDTNLQNGQCQAWRRGQMEDSGGGWLTLTDTDVSMYLGCAQHTPLGQDVPRAVGECTLAGGAGDLRELSVLSAPFCPWSPNLLKERINPMERQTLTWVNLISGSLGFWKRDGQIHSTLWISVLPEIPAYSVEEHMEPDEISLCTAAPVWTHFNGYGLWTSHRVWNPLCFRRLFPQWVNSSNCGKPNTCPQTAPLPPGFLISRNV